MGKPKMHDKEEELKKGPWTPEEDQKLLAYIKEHGHGSWPALPSLAGLQRCGKSCRLRWINYLRPDIKRGKFSSQEDMTIIRLHALLGNRWSAIAKLLPKRTDNEIKNYWNSRLKKLLTRMGIDPVTHKRKIGSCSEWAQSKQAAIVSHLTQWETARLEAEARLAGARKHMPSELHAQAQAPTPPQCLDVLRVWQATASSNSFFSSPGRHHSPTSTLNFSIPDAGAVNEAVSTNKEQVDKSVQLLQHEHFAGVDYGCNLQGSADHLRTNFDHDYNETTATVDDADLEDKENYWNELLYIVKSPLL